MPGGAWNGSWNGAAGIPAQPVLSVRFPVSSVQLVRAVHDDVVMVRRRSTVRFRNGAPGHGQFFERLERAAWNESWRRSSATVAGKAPIAQPEPGRQLWKVAAGGPSRNSRVTARGEVTLGRSSSGWAVTSDGSQDADSCRPGPGRPPAGRAEGTARRFTHMPMSEREPCARFMHSHAYFLTVRSTLSALMCSFFRCSGRKSAPCRV